MNNLYVKSIVGVGEDVKAYVYEIVDEGDMGWGVCYIGRSSDIANDNTLNYDIRLDNILPEVISDGATCLNYAICKLVLKSETDYDPFVNYAVKAGGYIPAFEHAALNDLVPCYSRVYHKSPAYYRSHNNEDARYDFELYSDDDSSHIFPIGMLVNHRVRGNVSVDGQVRIDLGLSDENISISLLTMFARRDINPGEMLYYDYGYDPSVPEVVVPVVGTRVRVRDRSPERDLGYFPPIQGTVAGNRYISDLFRSPEEIEHRRQADVAAAIDQRESDLVEYRDRVRDDSAEEDNDDFERWRGRRRVRDRSVERDELSVPVSEMIDIDGAGAGPRPIIAEGGNDLIDVAIDRFRNNEVVNQEDVVADSGENVRQWWRDYNARHNNVHNDALDRRIDSVTRIVGDTVNNPIIVDEPLEVPFARVIEDSELAVDPIVVMRDSSYRVTSNTPFSVIPTNEDVIGMYGDVPSINVNYQGTEINPPEYEITRERVLSNLHDYRHNHEVQSSREAERREGDPPVYRSNHYYN